MRMYGLSDWLVCFELPEVILGQAWKGCWKGPGAWKLKASHDSEIMSRPTLRAPSRVPALEPSSTGWPQASPLSLCPQSALKSWMAVRLGDSRPFIFTLGLSVSSVKWVQYDHSSQGCGKPHEWIQVASCTCWISVGCHGVHVFCDSASVRYTAATHWLNSGCQGYDSWGGDPCGGRVQGVSG